MKYFYILATTVVLFLFNSQPIKGQSNPMDTANYPYWISMMQDHSINFYSTQSAFNKYWKGRPVTKGSGWKPFKRWEYHMERIIDEHGNIPNPDNDVLEYQNFVNRYTNNVVRGGLGSGPASCNSQGDWQELGPIPLPTNQPSQPNGNGRINALEFHPTDSNIVWAGAPQGGLWKSTDEGYTWSSNTDALATLGVSDILIDPNNTSTMYLGTGDRDGGDARGLGIYKSTDGGVTWSASNTGMGNRVVSKVEIDPNSSSILLAATNAGIYRSTNSGANWSLVSSGNFKDLVFKPGSSDTAYATRNFRFFRTVNNGVTWTQITSGLPTAGNRGAIAVTPADPEMVYFIMTNTRTFRGMYMSIDGGSNFSTMSTTPNIMDYSHLGTGTGGQAWYDLDIAADPNNGNNVYVGGVNIFKSTDSGKTWAINAHWVGSGGAPAVHADNHVLEYNPVNGELYVGNDGGIYSTKNGGTSYFNKCSGLAIAQIYRLSQSKTNKDWILNGYQDNGTGMRRGKQWFTVMGGDGMDCQFDPSTTAYGYSDLYYGDVRRYTNGAYSGRIAANGVNGINEAGAWVTSFILREGAPGTMFIGYDNVWRSTNIQAGSAAAVTWTKISSLTGATDIHFLENCISDPNVMYISRKDNKLYKSSNVNAGTPTWTQINPPTSTYPRWIETDPNNTTTLYVAQSNNIYKSTNSGTSWTDISGNLPNSAIHCIVYDTSAGIEALYVGMSVGVYFKDATMANWALFNKGLPATSEITDLDIYYDPVDPDCSHIAASTYGRGNWKSYLYPSSNKKPKPKFYAEDTVMMISCGTATTSFVNESCNFPTRYLWDITPSTVSYVNGTDSCAKEPSVQFNTAAVYTVKLYAENCAGLDSLTQTQYITVYDSTKSATCVTTTTNNLTFLGVFDVTLNGMTNPSSGTGTEGSHVDFTCNKVVKLDPNTLYSMGVRVGSSNNEGVKAYIDYNNDGDFVDAGELLYTSTPTRPLHTNNFTTSTSPLYNTVLRMRVVSDFNTTSFGPCSVLNYGQSEDYGVYFELPEVKMAIDKDTVCTHELVSISDTSSFNSSGHSWNFGVGAIPATGTGKGPHSVKYSTGGFKTVTLTVGSLVITKDSMVFVKNGPSLVSGLLYGSIPACLGDSLVLHGVDTNNTSPSYQWYQDGVLLSGETDTIANIDSLYSVHNGSYTLVAISNGCTDTSAAIVVSANPAVTAGFSINDTNQCLSGNSFTFTNSSTVSSGTLSYTWDFGDGNNSISTNPSHTYIAPGTYFVKVVALSNLGCSDSIIKTVVVAPSPVAGFTVADTSQCLDLNSYDFTNSTTISSGTVSYNWDLGDGSTPTTTDVTHTYLTSGTFNVKLVATSNLGCKDSIIKIMEVRPEPVAAFTINNDSQCFTGNSFSFTNSSTLSSGTMTQDWFFGDNNSSTAQSPTHSYLSSGVYTVTLALNSNFGCVDTLRDEVSIFDSPTTDFSVNDSAQCLTNNSFTFTNNSTITTGTLSYNWDLGDGNSSTNTDVTHNYLSDGFYMVKLVANTGIGCKDSITRRVDINPQPVVGFTVNSDTQCFTGHTFIFNDTSSVSSGTYARVFYFGDNDSNTMSAPGKIYGFVGSYDVKLVITTDAGCMDSVTHTVAVQNTPAADFTINQDSQCLRFNQFDFTNTTAITGGTVSYQWDFGDGGTSTLQDDVNTYTQDGTYTVQLIADILNGCSDTTNQQVVVHPMPVMDFTIDDSTQCLTGNSYTFTDNSSIGTGTIATHSWDFGDGNTANTVSSSHNYLTSGNFNITKIGVSDFGCADTFVSRTEVYDVPSVDFTVGIDSQCLNVNSFTFTNNSSINSGSIFYDWDLGDGNSSLLQDVTHTYLAAGTYTVKLVANSNNQCKDSFDLQVFVLPDPIADFSVTDSSQCLDGNSFVIVNNSSVSSGTYSSAWDLGDGNSSNLNTPAAHTYSGVQSYTINLVVSTPFGCTDATSRDLIVHPMPVANFSINNDSQCLSGNSFLFSGSPSISSGTIAQIDWDFGDGNTLSGNNTPLHSYTADGSYSVMFTVVSSEGCSHDTSFPVRVFPRPTADFITPNAVCLGVPTNFLSSSSGNIAAENWDFGDGNTGSGSSTNHTYQSDGNYDVTLIVESNDGCFDTISKPAIAEVYPLPVASFTSTKISSLGKTATMQYNDQSTGANQWDWYFGDGNTGSGSSPTHTYSDTGTYTTLLVVQNSFGCVDSSQETKFIFPDYVYYVPTGFTPNDDGVNDVWRGIGLAYTFQFEMKVYDRWGELVWSTNDPQEEWDGTYAGDPLPMGAYIYIIDIEDLGRILRRKRGSITLIR
jgi:gliding motility-associated-like protein